MSQPPHLCFYSARCKYSAMFLEALAKTPFAKEFRFVCVDPGPSGQRPPLPAYVRAVPTLMIQGEPSPRTDNEVVNWLSERRVTAGVGPGPDDGPAAIGGEMAGIGDEGWAYIGEDTGSAQGQRARLTSTMVGLDNLHMIMAANGAGGSAAPMAPAGNAGPTARQTAKSKAFDDQLAAYAAARDMDLRPRGPGGAGAPPPGYQQQMQGGRR